MIGGGWTYTSIVDTKKELKGKTGTALEPAGPSGKGTAFAGGSHLVMFEDSTTRPRPTRSSTSPAFLFGREKIKEIRRIFPISLTR